MTMKRTHHRLSTVALAVLSVLSLSAQAQDEKTDQVDDEVEVIQVTGFKGSLQKSMNQKRFGGNVSDSINAEDVGKTTDQNIADALGRITGVTVVANNGEGTNITVRGATSNQNAITLNGQQLTSTGVSQSVDLSSFSADILSKLEVVKTPSADHDEGSLGGSINLTSVRPLSVKDGMISGTVQGRYNDFSDKYNHKLQASGALKFLDDTFGVAFTLYDETNAYRKDQYKVDDFRVTEEMTVARDQHGNIISNVRGIRQDGTLYELHQNASDRKGGNLGIQWAPSDVTELMFNVTYSEQTQERSYDAIKVRVKNDPNLIEGQKASTFTNDLATMTDPQEDWYTIDTDTYSMLKRVGRFNAGDISRSDGGTENTNLATSLQFKTGLTDTLRVSVQAGYSKSESESLPSLFTNLQNFAQVPAKVLVEAGDNIQEVGYDCTSGDCRIVSGDHMVDLGEHEFEYFDEEQGKIIAGYNDNIAYTGFNPADADSFHLGSIQENQTNITDELKSAQIDFDWDLELPGIFGIEFGAKYTARDKFVDQQKFTFNSNTKEDPVYDSDGNLVAAPGGPLQDIRAPMILSDGELEYDDFMETLGYEPMNDFARVDVWKAWDMVVGDPDLSRNVDATETRGTDIKTKAFYLKANLDLLDGQLTGDIGFRYVKTKVKGQNFWGGVFHDFPGNANESEFDWMTLKNLRDTSLPACPEVPHVGDGPIPDYSNKLSRIDGTGWDTSSGPDPSGWSRIEMFDPNGDGVQDACHDPNYAAWAYNQEHGMLPDWYQGEGDPVISWVTMWRYADVSTSRNHGWDASITQPNITWDGEGEQWSNYTVIGEKDKSVAAFPVENTHEYSNFLPSLNLNYAFSDSVIGRLALSKTMTRPEIDMLRPGFKVNELWATYWGGGRDAINPGRVTMYNTKLEPLESKNIDVSLEWYFNPSSMISVGVFHKDMSNFEDDETYKTYITDVRNIGEGFDPNTLIINATDDAETNYGLEGCMPLRTTTDLGWISGDPLSITDDYRDICHEFFVVKKINGKKAEITGVELGYQQIYDFLPGYFLSGLGMSANYTYQDSEYGTEESQIVEGEVQESTPVANTPKHTYNVTAFWEQDGHQLRLSYRGQSDSLIDIDWDTNLRGRNWKQGRLWREGRDTLDFSASYKISNNVSLTFQAINLTDAEYRDYFTSRELEVVPNSIPGDYAKLREGNPLEGDAPTSRTQKRYKVGTTYRLGIRANF